MDRIIFGDNQFFGINHMSEEKAQAQSERFKDLNAIIEVVEETYDCGIHAFMFNSNDRVVNLCNHFRAHPERYSDLRLYPSIPYPHKYANSVNEKGIVATLKDVIFADQSVGQVFKTLARGGMSIINQNMSEVIKLLVDAEMKMFRDLNVRAIFLQNVVTDLLVGIGIKEIFIEFAKHVKKKYCVDPAFITMNTPATVDFLLDCGIENPIVCSSINKIGYVMCPNRETVEETILTKPFRPMAMSILASGAISPQEAVKYIVGLGKIQSITFGASTLSHIKQTRDLIVEMWAPQETQRDK